jgi:microcin C transport system substrate-binding protein
VKLSRRTLLRSGASALAAPAALALEPLIAASAPAWAEEAAWRHGLSLFGDLKYPAGFPRFDYVNPQAPRVARRG